ncbi:hypothetical protein HPP92_007680 [Vanilla planifolia]|uniref:Uncharacterized protein n=1 Tax=Vanilla planifolia TaxID=51239 RepID=A0A835RRV3_VANPL|nr:hypothetical protein HPP92_007680 [Vanilla planifolia]
MKRIMVSKTKEKNKSPSPLTTTRRSLMSLKACLTDGGSSTSKRTTPTSTIIMRRAYVTRGTRSTSTRNTRTWQSRNTFLKLEIKQRKSRSWTSNSSST